jgi:hypothetical protein
VESRFDNSIGRDLRVIHFLPVNGCEGIELQHGISVSDLFLSGVNAITLNGELVNIDFAGNRTNATTYGPEKVILVAGYNKIVEDVQEAIKRIKNVAAPINAKRLNMDVPCAKVGKCVDCNSPNRICRVVVIHERKPSWTDILIILVSVSCLVAPVHAERIKDIAHFEGMRENQIIGFGLVVGLDGSGDKGDATLQSIANMLQRMGLTVRRRTARVGFGILVAALLAELLLVDQGPDNRIRFLRIADLEG